MLTQRTANLGFVVIVLALCGYFAWLAEGFTTSGLLASSGLPSKFFPQLTLGLTALCAVIVGIAYLFRGAAGGDDGETVFADGREARQGLSMLVVSVVCYFVWRYFGFLPMAILLGPLSLLAMSVFKPVYYVVVLSLTVVVTLIFVFGLGIQLI